MFPGHMTWGGDVVELGSSLKSGKRKAKTCRTLAWHEMPTWGRSSNAHRTVALMESPLQPRADLAGQSWSQSVTPKKLFLVTEITQKHTKTHKYTDFLELFFCDRILIGWREMSGSNVLNPTGSYRCDWRKQRRKANEFKKIRRVRVG